MLKTFRSIHINATLLISRKDNRWWGTEPHDCLRSGILGHTILKLIEVGHHRSQIVCEKIPNFNSSIIGYWGKARWSTWRPIYIIYLTSKRPFSWNLMATEFLNFFPCMPDFNCPVIRATYENWTVLRVPEGIATNPVNGSLMAIVIHQVLIRVRHTTLMYRALFCSSIIGYILPLREIDT